DVWSINGASAALCLSPLPFKGPIGAARVGLINDQFILFPTVQQLKESKLDLVVAGSEDSILMIEGFGDQIPEDQMADALMFGHRCIVELCRLQRDLASQMNVQKMDFVPATDNPFASIIHEEAHGKLRTARQGAKKAERREAVAAVREELVTRYFP